MNVLFITIAYPLPGLRNIYYDLMKEFKKNGHDVYVACSTRGKERQKTHVENEDGVTVLRIKTDNLIGQENLLKKGLSMLSMERVFVSAIKKHFNNIPFDLITYSTPPITLTKAIKYVKKRDRALTYLLLKDIFPQNAVDIGLMRKDGIIHKYFRKKEERLYSISDIIGCMSPANVAYILNNNPQTPCEKVEVCPNSITPCEKPQINKQTVKSKYGISDDAVVFIYGGSLGKPQGIDFFIRCLAENSGLTDRFFVVCGRGTEYKKVADFCGTENLNNILLINHLPKDEYDELVSACDVGLIFLDYRFTIPNFPSRLLSYMEYGIPVIAATDIHTDIKDIIADNKLGYWCESRDEKEFKRLVDKMCLERGNLQDMGNNARKHLDEHFTARVSYQIIMRHFSG